ncbi:cell wall hydrolase [Brevundimonas diminuta]|uniref:cell wall hydrolase n=1 Tax=Brevundimonas diminuta TaxID=293 RepID=UPI00209830A4|nr:cell wall hydrolase [Brevundimonas diminuta]MCO8019732.1 cell wall hydrolase [Brevundimonas diminuta]MCO8023007.1 cell wall hydrolase [Brevundimonas diminuta]
MIRFSTPRNAALVLPQTLALTLALSALAAPAGAQSTPRADQPQTQTQTPSRDHVAEMLIKGERYHRAPDSKQDPDELRRTQALNAEIVAQNDLAENEDRANQTAQAEAQRRWQAELDQTDADARAARERHEADLRAAGEAQARYDREMADWRATVAACERGDRARCNAGRQGPN